MTLPRPTLLLALCVTLASGCASFQRDWKMAAAAPTPTNTIEGRWDGTWKSDVNGHTDRLRCFITKLDDKKYKARFHAKYHQILSFGYTVTLDVQPTDGAYKLQGEADLGWLMGGVYHYEGRATPSNFSSTYKCRYDHGVFQLSRPVPEK